MNIWEICILFKQLQPATNSESFFAFLQPFLAAPTGQMIECMYLSSSENGSSSRYTVSGFSEVTAGHLCDTMCALVCDTSCFIPRKEITAKERFR